MSFRRPARHGSWLGVAIARPMTIRLSLIRLSEPHAGRTERLVLTMPRIPARLTAEALFTEAWRSIAPPNVSLVGFALTGTEANNLVYGIATNVAQK